MKALCWHGTGDVRVDTVADPTIQDPRDIVIKITSTAICGSDLHLFNGFQPTMEKGDQLGHENMGEVVEVGSGISALNVGDRVVVPFTICCGECFFCQKGLYSCCDRTNPNAEMAKAAMGHSPAGLFGFSHMMGGYAGGQAEYLRVPFADVAPIKIPDGIPDEKVLFLSDIFPTGYMAAENCGIEPGDTVAVWGCGPVGQFAMQSAWMLGAGRVIGIDRVPERLRMAEQHSKAETINFDDVKVYDRLMEMTNGRGPDRCIDAVGAEAHGSGSFDAVLDKAKAAVMLGTDRPHVLREAIMCCRKAGTISVPGVYIGLLDKIPFGAAMNKGITFRMGQTHVPRYTKPLLEKIQSGVIDPSSSSLIASRSRMPRRPTRRSGTKKMAASRWCSSHSGFHNGGDSSSGGEHDALAVRRGSLGHRRHPRRQQPARMALIERYVRTKEKQAAGAKPDIDYIEENSCDQAEALIARLAAIPPGREAVRDYQFLVLEILNYLFNPDLTDDGTERRDIIFTNESDEAFWDYVRTSHDSIFVMFETKNTDELDAPAINQTATYLGDRVGRLGVIVTRQPPTEAMQRKMFSVWNDSSPRKTILTLADADFRQLLELRCKNASPTAWMQKHYRAFRTAVQ